MACVSKGCNSHVFLAGTKHGQTPALKQARSTTHKMWIFAASSNKRIGNPDRPNGTKALFKNLRISTSSSALFQAPRCRTKCTLAGNIVELFPGLRRDRGLITNEDLRHVQRQVWAVADEGDMGHIATTLRERNRDHRRFAAPPLRHENIPDATALVQAERCLVQVHAKHRPPNWRTRLQVIPPLQSCVSLWGGPAWAVPGALQYLC